MLEHEWMANNQLTKRELIALEAMKAIINKEAITLAMDWDIISCLAVDAADSLLRILGEK
jgi:hypothetical protein